MAVTQTGSILTLPISSTANTGTVSTTITVPSDAEIAVVGVSGFTGTANAFSSGGMTLTKGGSDTAMTAVALGNANATFWQAGLFYLVLPDTGSNKTLKWDWVGSGLSGNADFIFSVTFWKGIDQASPVRGSGGGQASGMPYTSTSITALTGDLVVAFVGGSVGSEGSVTGWTNLTLLSELTFNTTGDATWATSSPSGNTTVSVDSGFSYSDGGIVAISLKAAATGPTKVIFITATGAGTFTIPADWTATNTIEVLGAGAGGMTAAGAAAGGGGGGQYRKLTNVSGLSGTINLSVGAGGGAGIAGGNTWWGSTTFGGATVSAQGGQTTSSGTAGVGGSTGAGGTGANGGPAGAGGTALTGGAGGGAAGPGGVGGTGGRGDNTTTGADFGGSGGSGAGLSTIGGNGGVGSTSAGAVGTNATGGGPGGAGGSGAGATPAAGTGVWTSTHLPDTTTVSVVTKSPGGGGGGGGSGSGAAGSATNSHGGGGGGAGNGTGGTGGNGLIVITYETPFVAAVPEVQPQDVPQRPQYLSSLYSWIAGAGFLALAAASTPCGEASAANPARVLQRDVSCAPYNMALLTPTAAPTVYLPCVVTTWAPPDGLPQTNRDWVNTGVPTLLVEAAAPKPFTQVDQSNPRAGPVTSRDWTARISRSLFAKPAFTQVDQANPRLPVQPNRDWTASSRSLFVKPPPSNYDWPLPRRPQSGQSYTQNLSLVLSAKPPTNSNWQLPRGSQSGQSSWAGQAPPVAVVVKPPSASCWPLPIRLAPADTSWVQTPQQVAAAVVSYLPCVVTGWSIPDGLFQPNRDWVGQPPPTIVGAVTTYLPCVVTGWAPPDTPFQSRRDWFSRGVPPTAYTFRDPFLATRLTLQYDRKVHSQAQPSQALTILSAPPVFYGRPCQVVVSGVNDPPPAGRSWINEGGPLLTPPKVRPPQVIQENPRRLPFRSRDWTTPLGATPAPAYERLPSISQENPRRPVPWARDWINAPGPLLTPPQVRPPLIAQENPKQGPVTNRDWVNRSRTLPFPKPLKRTFDYPLPKQPPVTNRDWVYSPAALRTPPAGVRPPTRYSWPLPRRVADTNRDWIGPDSVIRRVPTVTPPGVAPGGGGPGFSYQRYERLVNELYQKKKKLPRKAKKALAKAIVVVEKIDTSAADLARLLQALEAAAAISTQNTLANINAAHAVAAQARAILEQQRLQQLREEDDLILLMLDQED